MNPASERALDEAAEWLSRCQAGEARPEELQRWRAASPEHEQAWQRAERLLAKFGSLPAALALPALDRPPALARRAALRHLGKTALFLGLLPSSWLAHRLVEAAGWIADYRTAIGERREILLPDETRLTLNTGTALDVRFTAEQRLLRLRSGEVLVETGHADTANRPLQVLTRHGSATPLGTRFTVRDDGAATEVAVLEGSVHIAPAAAGHGARTLLAGQRSRFTDHGSELPQAADAGIAAWTRGMLLADAMPLSSLCGELSRYRHGLVECQGEVGDWRISGAFPVGAGDATERSLAMLAATYPLQVRQRLGGLWVTLSARP